MYFPEVQTHVYSVFPRGSDITFIREKEKGISKDPLSRMVDVPLKAWLINNHSGAHSVLWTTPSSAFLHWFQGLWSVNCIFIISSRFMKHSKLKGNTLFVTVNKKNMKLECTFSTCSFTAISVNRIWINSFTPGFSSCSCYDAGAKSSLIKIKSFFLTYRTLLKTQWDLHH